ncbi:polysaccharide biosynthesis protein [Anditalea andensis]|uniref:Polysaccharide biosynthesis protein n=1 Tax=Anditalea andensis TaxID=1048983 RepID=A0A074KWP5_9BACT|nr:nucleoside-diphosphate sugar epimerase/dehydratase [Anditalea andensis]KEO72605.1 polysaccharide biosynthesis protein [Anditalea andensis]
MAFLKNINILPRWVIAALDTTILFYSVIFAYLLRLNFEWSEIGNYYFLESSLFFTFTGVIIMLITRSYQGIVRHTGVKDAFVIARTILFTFLIVALVDFSYEHILNKYSIMPLTVIIIASIISLSLLVFYRLMVKEIFGFAKNKTREFENVVIFGAGEAGMLAHEVLMNDTKINKKVIAFIDDDAKKAGKFLGGSKIYGNIQDLEFLSFKYNVKELIISTQDIPSKRKREIIDECLRLDIHSSIIPPIDEWMSGGLNAGGIREVKIEDLLSRDSISLDSTHVSEELAGKVVLVTGAGGSIGSEIAKQVAHYNPKLLIMLDQAESALYEINHEILSLNLDVDVIAILADIRKVKNLSDIFKKYNPQIVFHAAAYKHVPMMESYPEEAVKCNILGTRNLADLSVEYKAEKFVMISTDKAVNPTNVMGASKRIAEMYVQSLNDFISGMSKGNTKFITTRFGNVLGSNGSVIPLFKRQIEKGGPVTVTHPDITRYFMTIPEACQLVLEAGVMGNGGEIFVFDMGEPVKIVDLARKMIQLSGKKVDQDIKITYSGLRQGEKLYEELLNNEEEVKETHHPKIMIAKVSKVSFEDIHEQLELFNGLLNKSSDVSLVSHMKTIVPEFISNSSRFNFLDSRKEAMTR